MFQSLTSQVVMLPRKDIDTDLIIPAEFLRTTERTGLGKHLFARVRSSDQDFEMLETHPEAQVIVAGENFGCGSSREHAAWALHDWGIRVILAPSFANIFYNNALKNGLLPVVLDEVIIEKIMIGAQEHESYEVTVNLQQQKIVLPDDEECFFDIDSYRKTCLLQGIDDMDYLLSHKKDIAAFDAQHKEHLFFDLSRLS